MKLLTVGQMAKLNHVSDQTLRLYDRIGLLFPNIRGDNGYRYYEIRQSAMLDLIQYMKSLGIPLREIKLQLERRDLDWIEAVLREKQHQTQQEIERLKCQYTALERTVEGIARYRTAPPDGTLQMEYIRARQMYLVDTGVNVYEHDAETYEGMLRSLQDQLVQDKLPQIYFCNPGTVLRKEDLLAKRFYSTEVFVFVDAEFVPKVLTQSIPAGNYACMYCDDFYKEKGYITQLLDFVQQSGCEVCGDYLCESISEIPVAEQSCRRMFLRLQVPIKYGQKTG